MLKFVISMCCNRNSKKIFSIIGKNKISNFLILWGEDKYKKYDCRVRYFILLDGHTDFRNAMLTNYLKVLIERGAVFKIYSLTYEPGPG
ncbi:hypothetical protein [Phytobacter massiliensis]|uniref:hypothetical protein n=1 Tax=Phytobacter massiliensis TaxID=1485952 RepID=UPI0002E41D0E|nr:hypothetical protein [Phytobacter massiliensis]